MISTSSLPHSVVDHLPIYVCVYFEDNVLKIYDQTYDSLGEKIDLMSIKTIDPKQIGLYLDFDPFNKCIKLTDDGQKVYFEFMKIKNKYFFKRKDIHDASRKKYYQMNFQDSES